MAPRLSVVLAAGALACVALAGCGESGPTAAPAAPSEYIEAVDALLQPPARLASMISQAAGSETTPAPSRARLRDLVAGARRRLAEFRALQLVDPALWRQRDRLAIAYSRMIPRMQTAADALAGGDRAALPAAAGPFLDSLRTLPSGAGS